MKNLQIKGRWHIFNAYVAEVEINFQKVTQVYTVYIFIFVFSVEQTRIWVNGMYGEGKEVCLPKGSIFFFQRSAFVQSLLGDCYSSLEGNPCRGHQIWHVQA